MEAESARGGGVSWKRRAWKGRLAGACRKRCRRGKQPSHEQSQGRSSQGELRAASAAAACSNGSRWRQSSNARRAKPDAAEEGYLGGAAELTCGPAGRMGEQGSGLAVVAPADAGFVRMAARMTWRPGRGAALGCVSRQQCRVHAGPLTRPPWRPPPGPRSGWRTSSW